MTVAAWVLLVWFGIPVLALTRKFLFGRLNNLEVAIWMASTFIVSLAAGVIWGGLGG